MGKEEKARKREEAKRVQKTLGFNPSYATLAAGLGAQSLGSWPHGIMEALDPIADPGRPLKNTPMGVQISELADFTHREAKAIRQFAKEQGVKIPIVASDVDYFTKGTGRFDNLLRRLGRDVPDIPEHIGLRTTSIPTAFHEISHAKPIAGSKTLRDAWQYLAHSLDRGSVGGALRMALLAGAAAPTGESDTRRFIQENAPALMGATYAPGLLEELRATTGMVRGMSRQGLGGARGALAMAPALGTYIVPAVASVLGALLAKRLGSSLRDAAAARQEKTAADPGELKAPGALRLPASSAWRMSSSAAKPKTTTPQVKGTPVAKDQAKANLPQKNSFYRDLLTSLYNPQRGFRMAVR